MDFALKCNFLVKLMIYKTLFGYKSIRLVVTQRNFCNPFCICVNYIGVCGYFFCNLILNLFNLTLWLVVMLD